MKKKNIAIVGAHGAVGSEIRSILEERNFPVGEIRFFGSERTKGKTILFRGKNFTTRQLGFCEEDFRGIDFVLSSPGATISRKFVPFAVQAGATVIDNTSAFRMDPKIPLVIPEINARDLKGKHPIIANPNCSTIIMLMAIAPLHRKNRVKRIVCATYQSASGAGAMAMRELRNQTAEFFQLVEKDDDLFSTHIYDQKFLGGRITKKVFPHQIAFNLFSHNSSIAEDGYNEEERKVMQETKKILHDKKIKIAITCVRVPVFRAHSQAIHLEFENPMSVRDARRILDRAQGVELVDDREQNYFPMPIEASGKDSVLTGRIREDRSVKNGLALFVSGDQLRKGAALNAVQIAEVLVKSGK